MKLAARVTMKGNVFEGKGRAVVRRELEDGMVEAVMYLANIVKQHTPQGVGGAEHGLMATIHGELQKGAPVVKGVVGHMKPYGDVIEMGRTAGKAMPPEGTLIRWIEKKMGVDEATAARIEFAVRRKIGRKGFEGAEMFEKAFDEGWPVVQSIFDRRGFAIAKGLGT